MESQLSKFKIQYGTKLSLYRLVNHLGTTYFAFDLLVREVSFRLGSRQFSLWEGSWASTNSLSQSWLLLSWRETRFFNAGSLNKCMCLCKNWCKVIYTVGRFLLKIYGKTPNRLCPCAILAPEKSVEFLIAAIAAIELSITAEFPVIKNMPGKGP